MPVQRRAWLGEMWNRGAFAIHARHSRRPLDEPSAASLGLWMLDQLVLSAAWPGCDGVRVADSAVAAMDDDLSAAEVVHDLSRPVDGLDLGAVTSQPPWTLRQSHHSRHGGRHLNDCG